MNWTVTLGAIAVLLALGIVCIWRDRQPPHSGGEPRMVPWSLLMMFCAAGLILLLVHMVSLARASGVE